MLEMIINDSAYGKVKITDPVLVDLITSKPLQRLKGVNQYGTQLVYSGLTITRFDHCVGVMILLKRFNAPLEEQIAGLLHDISHTVFSHVIDFAFGHDVKQGFHERYLKKVVLNSEIPKILKNYGFDVKRVIDHSNFPLLEQDLPALCADRIDYTLKDQHILLTKKQIKAVLDSIKIENDQFVLTDKNLAMQFSNHYINLSENSWISAHTLGVFKVLAYVIRLGLNKKILSRVDLFTTDNAVLKKLKSSKDKKVLHLLSLLTPKFAVVEDESNYDFFTKGKPRFIDPPILANGKTKKLSELDKAYAKRIKNFQKRMAKGHYIRVISGNLDLSSN